jgi:hypothetical protein
MIVSFEFNIILDEWFMIDKDSNEEWPEGLAYATGNTIYNKNTFYLIGGST